MGFVVTNAVEAAMEVRAKEGIHAAKWSAKQIPAKTP
jgi:hypothetical protein